MPGLRGGRGTDGRGSSGCGAAPSLGDRGRAAISRDGGKFTADAIGTDDTGSGRGFSFFLSFFFCHSCLVSNSSGAVTRLML